MLAGFHAAFGRPDVSLSAISGLCKRNGWLTGRTGRIEKGSVPANKGKKMPWHPNSARTQFKKGREPHNTKFLGHERLNRQGYFEISVDEVNPHTGYPRRYVLKHLHLWQKEHGPLPEGHCLKCLDGDRRNCDPANWIAVPRSMLPRLAGGRWGRTGYDEAPATLRPVILTAAHLEHAIRRLKNGC